MFLKVFVIGEKGIMRWTLTAAGQYCARGDTEWCVLTMRSVQFRFTFSAGFGVPYPSDSPHLASREHGAKSLRRIPPHSSPSPTSASRSTPTGWPASNRSHRFPSPSRPSSRFRRTPLQHPSPPNSSSRSSTLARTPFCVSMSRASIPASLLSLFWLRSRRQASACNLTPPSRRFVPSTSPSRSKHRQELLRPRTSSIAPEPGRLLPLH